MKNPFYAGAAVTTSIMQAMPGRGTLYFTKNDSSESKDARCWWTRV